MRRRSILIAAGAVVALGGAGAAAVGFGGDSPGTQKRSTQPSKTSDITKATLVDYEEVGGDLGYGATVPLRYSGQGIVTWLPAVGVTVDRGQPLFKVDNEPVVLLHGPLPLYRPLALGTKGPDVQQFEDNLKALGYTGFTVDEDFSASTESAVKRWQHSLKVAETGVLDPGQALCAAGAIRVAQHSLRVGDPAGGEVYQYTSVVRSVTVHLPIEQRRYAAPGTAVTVTLPLGTQVAGKVEAVSQPVSSGDNNNGGGEGGQATVVVDVSVADQNALGALQSGPVKVKFVSDQRKDVLTVPVSALLALAEGGYGVQVVEGSTSRYVAVETGLFAGGRVEIRGNGLQPGMKVGVPK